MQHIILLLQRTDGCASESLGRTSSWLKQEAGRAFCSERPQRAQRRHAARTWSGRSI